MKNVFLCIALTFFLSSATGQKEEVIFKVVEEMPRFPGCEDIAIEKEKQHCTKESSISFINRNIKYPEEALKNEAFGKIVAEFIIQKDGSMTDINVISDEAGYGCDAAFKQVLAKMSDKIKWESGKQLGKSVKVLYTIAMEIDLRDVASQPTPPPPPTPKKEEEIFKVVEEMPRFPGCEDNYYEKRALKECAKMKLMDYVYSNLIYPESAKENRIEGKCYVQFVVNEIGDISDVRIVRDIGYGCGEAVKTVAETMNDMPEKWVPGKQRGRPVKVLFTLPVEFKLDKKRIIREYDKTLEEAKIIIINNADKNGHHGKFHIYKNDRKILKLGENEYESIDIEALRQEFFIHSSEYKTDSYALKLSILNGQTVYLSIVRDDIIDGAQYYKLIEITTEEAQMAMDNLEKKR